MVWAPAGSAALAYGIGDKSAYFCCFTVYSGRIGACVRCLGRTCTGSEDAYMFVMGLSQLDMPEDMSYYKHRRPLILLL